MRIPQRSNDCFENALRSWSTGNHPNVCAITILPAGLSILELLLREVH